MDNAKQFAYYPVAVLKGVNNFSNGTISMKFKTIAGESDRCSGILFNVKPNGDWLAIRYNDTENNVVALGVPQRHPPLGEARRRNARSCSIAPRGTS